jgi:hypothetical protein
MRYPVVREAMRRLQCSQTTDDAPAVILWWDGLMPNEDFANILPHQRVNRIPGMDMMCYKKSFFQALVRMKGLFASFYNFFPTTFQLPFQFSSFQREHLQLTCMGSNVTWILKPRCGCSGHGIRLIQDPRDITDKTQAAIIQRYMTPFLLNGYKFDFRFYILISRLEPFTFFLYEEGLARFCSHVYKPPTRETLDDRFCHLTNTSVNMTNHESNRRIVELSSTVIEQICHMDEKGRNLWARIRQLVVLSLIAQYQSILQNVAIFGAQPPRETHPSREGRTQMRGELRKYFQILGIDIMLTDTCEPVVLELNDRPSLVVTYDVEHGLKSRLIYDVLNVVAADADETELAQRRGGWQQLFPMDENLPFGKAAVTMLRRSIQNISGAHHIWTKKAPTGRGPNTSAGKRSSLPPLHQ